MWFAKCVICGKDIKDGEPCIPHYDFNGKHYRHLACHQEVKPPLDYVPFGEVTDADLQGEGD